jgi:hypothetical protein
MAESESALIFAYPFLFGSDHWALPLLTVCYVLRRLLAGQVSIASTRLLTSSSRSLLLSWLKRCAAFLTGQDSWGSNID